ncbi:hypothetical protein [Maritimibacter sp. UBA3975]|uniref:hypothetical protein n=1 Tax=Maritimibacter sp. UBA3975 TaxID=1946833 RepID=UPI000C09A41A|nr:hypothetical protein [Maritimibacter sp. UBA3975]MAM60595.1 hypothetical protein [Maritimibacter sp.]|tara:strand:- start:31326 stop:31514 length:189 start_codon:yes stop_codon:yes gene_type:complete
MNWNMRHFFRMAKWARKPPGEKQVKMLFAVIAVCLALFAIERLFGWPDWLTVDGAPRTTLTR